MILCAYTLYHNGNEYYDPSVDYGTVEAEYESSTSTAHFRSIFFKLLLLKITIFQPEILSNFIGFDLG